MKGMAGVGISADRSRHELDCHLRDELDHGRLPGSRDRPAHWKCSGGDIRTPPAAWPPARFSAIARPPWARAIALTMARPRPLPSYPEPAERVNGWKLRSSTCRSKPGPKFDREGLVGDGGLDPDRASGTRLSTAPMDLVGLMMMPRGTSFLD